MSLLLVFWYFLTHNVKTKRKISTHYFFYPNQNASLCSQQFKVFRNRGCHKNKTLTFLKMIWWNFSYLLRTYMILQDQLKVLLKSLSPMNLLILINLCQVEIKDKSMLILSKQSRHLTTYDIFCRVLSTRNWDQWLHLKLFHKLSRTKTVSVHLKHLFLTFFSIPQDLRRSFSFILSRIHPQLDDNKFISL